MVKGGIDRAKGLLLYDSDCGFCRFWTARWRAHAGGALKTVPLTEAEERPPGLTPEQYAGSIHYRAPDGTWRSAAAAVFELLALTPGQAFWRWMYLRLPGFAPVSEAVYRVVSRRRKSASFVSRWLWGTDPEPPRYALTRWVFLRGLSLTAAVAFASFWLQIDGLLGSGGIAPAAELVAVAKQKMGGFGLYRFPTVLWLGSSDAALHALCAAGTGASLAAFFGVLTAPMLWLAWLLYLSLCAVGQEFLGYQWDMLLLETLVLGALWAPGRLVSRFETDPRPSAVPLWLLRWLLFRLMFASGVVKLASGDEAWRSLSALWYHYETQPLPTWVGWWAHQLPRPFHTASAAAMFFIELAAPFLVFLPRNPRLAAAILFLFLQALIGLTGNYCYFNVLSVLLCLCLVDDDVLRAMLPARAAERLGEPPSRAEPPRWQFRLRLGFGALLAALGLVPLLGALFRWAPGLLAALFFLLSPLRLVNGYGLFAVMTTQRDEILVEGSHDGKEWKEYVFPYKPSALDKRPGFVAPHQPRLDWQMWFAALGRCEDNPWFVRFVSRLMEHSKPVRGLLAHDPFPEGPPRWIRTRLLRYRFTSWKEGRETGNWWAREEKGNYCPMFQRID